jgi:uncharacterized SAM-binding protein YcdF (DUF218 family)
MFFVSKVLSFFIFPVGAACLLIGVSIVAQYTRRYRLAMVANLAALAVLWLMGSRIVAGALLRPLEMRDLSPSPMPKADAIVVLGGCTGVAFPPQPTVHLIEGADRIVYAAELYREGKAPLVILSGGGGKGFPESAQMAEIIQLMGVPKAAILEESSARNTHENAVNVRPILLAHQIHRVLLVTSAASMPRAMAVFTREGIDAVPAPTDFLSTDIVPLHSMKSPRGIVRQMYPDSATLDESTRAVKEYFGLLGYRLAGWI